MPKDTSADRLEELRKTATKLPTSFSNTPASSHTHFFWCIGLTKNRKTGKKFKQMAYTHSYSESLSASVFGCHKADQTPHLLSVALVCNRKLLKGCRHRERRLSQQPIFQSSISRLISQLCVSPPSPTSSLTFFPSTLFTLSSPLFSKWKPFISSSRVPFFPFLSLPSALTFALHAAGTFHNKTITVLYTAHQNCLT